MTALCGPSSAMDYTPDATFGQLSQVPMNRHRLQSIVSLHQRTDHEEVDRRSATDIHPLSYAADRLSDGAEPILDTPSGNNRTSSSREQKPEQLPPWIDLKTKAGKERKRLPLACIACRRKKIRCSGEKPACKHCLRSRIPCVYRVTMRKAAPRTDYMAMLDKRLKRMEDRIIKIIPKDESKDGPAFGRAVVKPMIPGSAALKTANSKKRAAEEAFGGTDLDRWANDTAPKESDPEIRPTPLEQTRPEAELSMLTEGASALPSVEIQEHLVEVFFDCVYGQSYHLLHKPSFMMKLR